MNNLEQLHEDELEELFSLIINVCKGKTNSSSLQICSRCQNGNPRNSVYCNKCGHKV